MVGERADRRREPRLRAFHGYRGRARYGPTHVREGSGFRQLAVSENRRGPEQITPSRQMPARLSESVHVNADTPEVLMESLSRRGWKRVYVDGGQVIQSFLTAGLIEDLIITRIPVLLGSGRPLFGPLPNDVQLDHVETTAFPSGLVQSKYRVRSDD